MPSLACTACAALQCPACRPRLAGRARIAGGSANLGDGTYGAVVIGATPGCAVVGRAIGASREEALDEALQLVRDGALDTAEANPVVKRAMRGLRKLVRRRAGNRRPRTVEDDEALDLVGLARHAESMR